MSDRPAFHGRSHDGLCAAGCCNDCGAEVPDLNALAEHAERDHPGMGRIRFWDGSKEVVVSNVPVVAASDAAALQARVVELEGKLAKLMAALQSPPSETPAKGG